MGESESRLGFKSRFGRFGGMIRQILGLIRHERLGFDLVRYFLGFDSKRGIRQPNLSQLSVLPFSVFCLFTSVSGELKIALHAVIVVRKMAAPTPCSSLSLSEPAAAVAPNVYCATSDNFPTLKVLARKYFSIPATSASVERLFSVSGCLMSAHRNRLNDSTVEALLLRLEMLRQQQADPSS